MTQLKLHRALYWHRCDNVAFLMHYEQVIASVTKALHRYCTGRETHVHVYGMLSPDPRDHCEAERNHRKDLRFCEPLVDAILENMEKRVRNVFNDLGLPAGRRFPHSTPCSARRGWNSMTPLRSLAWEGPRSQLSRRPSGNWETTRLLCSSSSSNTSEAEDQEGDFFQGMTHCQRPETCHIVPTVQSL